MFNNRPSTFSGPNQNYLKFIILGHQRSGSTLIMRALRHHPQVVEFGEIFIKNRIGFGIEGYDNFSIPLLQAREQYPIEFLDSYIFSKYQEEKKAVGFKLFPDQLDNQHYRCVWDWIEQNKDIAIIFLSRKNKLETYTSLLTAKKTGVWGISDTSQRPTDKVTIYADEFVAEVRKRESYELFAKERISNHRVLEMSYEDINEDPCSRILEVQSFLGLDSAKPILDFVKTEVRPLSEVISNYYELKEYFANTEWSIYFK